MAFGIQCFNDSSELTVSSDGYFLTYLGRATLDTLHHASGVSTSSTGGYATWKFTHAGPVMAAILLRAPSGSGGSCIFGQRQIGGVWYFDVLDVLNTTESIGSTAYQVPRSDSEIYVFGVPDTLGAFGMAIYGPSGDLRGDLTGKPLAAAARVSLGSGVSSTTIPALTKPAIMGDVYSYHNTSVSAGGGFWNNTGFDGIWTLGSPSTNLSRTDIVTAFDKDDSSVPTFNVRGATNAIMIEANGLP